MRKRWGFLALAAALACAHAPAAADEMLAWDKIAVQTLREERVPREQADEALTLVRSAVDDAMNQASPMNAGLSADLAAAAAAHRVLTSLFPTRKARLDARLERSFAGVDLSIAQPAYDLGRAAADATLEAKWKWQRPRVRGPVGPPLRDQALPIRARLDRPLPAPKSMKLHQGADKS